MEQLGSLLGWQPIFHLTILGETIDAVKLMMDNPDVTTRELDGSSCLVQIFRLVLWLWGNQVFIRPMKQVKVQLFFVLVQRLKNTKTWP